MVLSPIYRSQYQRNQINQTVSNLQPLDRHRIPAGRANQAHNMIKHGKTRCRPITGPIHDAAQQHAAQQARTRNADLCLSNSSAPSTVILKVAPPTKVTHYSFTRIQERVIFERGGNSQKLPTPKVPTIKNAQIHAYTYPPRMSCYVPLSFFLATDPNFSFGEAYQGVPLTCLNPTTFLLMCALPL